LSIGIGIGGKGYLNGIAGGTDFGG